MLLVRLRLCAGVRLADAVEVEVVRPVAREEVDDFPTAGQPVTHGAWHGVALSPNDLVADRPAVLDQRERQALGPEKQALGTRPLLAGGVAVSEVQPDASGWSQDAIHLAQDSSYSV